MLSSTINYSLYLKQNKENKQNCRSSSSSPSLLPHKRKVTGLIPGGRTQNLLLVATVSSPKLVSKMLPALKGQNKEFII